MNKKGFTLIEILIVVAIIGILASVVLVGLGPLQRQGRDARRISDLKQVQTGLELFYNRNCEYPSATTWGDLKTTLEGANVGITNIPVDPNPNRDYYYGTDNTTYVLGAELDDSENPVLTNGSKSPEVDTFSVPCATANVYCVQL